MLGSQEVAISFADWGPIKTDKKTPKKVKIKTIETPKKTASK